MDLKSQMINTDTIAACKFNSGLFKVPWKDTEKIIDELEIDMTVYELK